MRRTTITALVPGDPEPRVVVDTDLSYDDAETWFDRCARSFPAGTRLRMTTITVITVIEGTPG